ncbi:MAG: SAM-dependent methyltransferase [Burkholderiales bacterium]
MKTAAPAADEAGSLENLVREVGDFYAWSRNYWMDLGRDAAGTASGMLNFGLWDAATVRMFDAQENLVRLVFERLGALPPGAQGLEIGCGIGGAAIRLARAREVRLTCMDLVPEQIAIARGLAEAAGVGGRIVFRQGSSMAMPFADASFDFSYCIESSFHYPDKPAFFRENHRVLKPGATALLADITCEDNSLVAFRKGNYFCAVEETRRLVREAGFAVVETVHIGERVFRPLLDYVEAYNAGRRDKLCRYWNVVLKNYAKLAAQGKMGYEIFVLRKAR